MSKFNEREERRNEREEELTQEITQELTQEITQLTQELTQELTQDLTELNENDESTTNTLEDKQNLIDIFLLGSSVKHDVLHILSNDMQDIDSYLNSTYSPEEIPAKKQSIINRLDLINNKLFIKYTPNVTRYAEKKITLSSNPRQILTGADVKMYLINTNTNQIINIDYIMPHTSLTRQEVLFSDLVKLAESKGIAMNTHNNYNIHVVDTTCSVFKQNGRSVSSELCQQLQRDISNLFSCEVSQQCRISYGGKRKKSLKSTKKKQIKRIKLLKSRKKKRIKRTKSNKRRTKRRATNLI